MTLNISLVVPDGIILASDSLATQMQQLGNQKLKVQTACSCGRIETREVLTPPLIVPASSWPYAQKIFPIKGVFGLATFGNGFVNSRSIYSHIDELNPHLPDDDEKEDYFEKISKLIVEHFENQLRTEWKKTNVDENSVSDTFYPFGFQFCGYKRNPDGEMIPSIRQILIGKKSKTDEFIGQFGCVPTGDPSVVTILWQNNTNVANYMAFSLQDAVDYAKFLIRTTSEFQRFLGKFPTVGGDVDVALITNQGGFKWLSQKPMYRMLERVEQP
jgi:hypothetical protein